jgi:hypothetical protein
MHFALLFIFTPIMRTQAYLDPGSGSFLIQLLIAGVVGAGFLIKVYWKKIKAFFNRSEPKKEDDEQIQQ